ncbi:MAG: hypothetical protein JWN85_3226 [Gammaproteobacteria bacterium]|nr:hypothetical protein [Gammaproteobacteria bacterium]
MKTLCIIGLLSVASACSLHGGNARALRCDGRLQPINAPGRPGASVQKTPAPPSGKSLMESP